MNYDFSTLNDRDLEQLVRDLLNEKFKLGLQDFKQGIDGGIDLRYSTPENNNSIVVQVKHYRGSGKPKLINDLKTKELKKARELKPQRYIIATSVALSRQDKDNIKDLFQPFIQTCNDVIGKEDLNTYLTEFREIEKRHFKLWFSSINVFNTILNNAVEGRTQYLLRSIKEKAPFYVETQKLPEALTILEKEKLLLITGQPGIGKTTLAKILLWKKAMGEYKVIEVKTIREAEDMISLNDDEKQVFYFDDFLGANYIQIANEINEQQITSFAERVRITPNKYLILTSRTIILKQALEKYEKINRSTIAHSHHQFEINLTNYSEYEKALILYNHIYFSNINPNLCNAIFKNKFYKKIIAHKNYIPRIIEFITDEYKTRDIATPEKYMEFILSSLDKPNEIWQNPFLRQIGYLERCLLLTLFTFEKNVNEDVLMRAFQERLAYEKENNHTINSNQFAESIKILLDGFITCVWGNQKEYSFINPSLTDFLIGYVEESKSERKAIISNICYIEQLNRFNPRNPYDLIPLEKELQEIIYKKIENNKLEILASNEEDFTENLKYGIILETLWKYCNDIDIDSELLANFKKIDFGEDIEAIFGIITPILLDLSNAPLTFGFIKEHFIEIIESIMGVIDENENSMFRKLMPYKKINKAEIIPTLFKIYQYDYEEYAESKNGQNKLKWVIRRILKTREDNIPNELNLKWVNRRILTTTREDNIASKNTFTISMKDIEDFHKNLPSMQNRLETILFPKECPNLDLKMTIDKDYWDKRIEESNKSRMPMILIAMKLMTVNSSGDKILNEKAKIEKDIDDLFKRE